MSEKTPYNYKRSKEHNLPFIRANRVLIQNEVLPKVINARLGEFTGENEIVYTEVKQGDQLDLERALMILVQTVASLQFRIEQLEQELQNGDMEQT